ncbi:STAS domain-containing protein [Streptomyces sp. NPDC091272]|uniref:STAS domain-containing protein n=1 Tax=Streptomyces sp. NPDC091272 TaxID=3365981 RepID=UPI0038071307
MSRDRDVNRDRDASRDRGTNRDLGPSQELTVAVQHREAGLVLAVHGDLDFDNAPRLRTTIARLTLAPGQLLVLDLSGLTFFDSSGVTMLIIARKVALAAGAQIAISGVSSMAAKIFRITGLDSVFPFFPDPAAAFGKGRGHPGAGGCDERGDSGYATG